jgi:single-strand DNA-binding protein
MVSFNQVVLAGNLTRDPELKYIPSGAAVCEFSLAVNRKWKSKEGEQKEEVGFFDCVAWGRTAELIAEHVKKGNPLLVSGYLKHERWEDQGGNNRSRVRINVMMMQFLGGKRDSGAPPAQESEAAQEETLF